ncbi:MAG: OB-fold domain-containing protein [Proteobacteria bacterium]|nr:OB-fold domain-containing protein [Pseudomonadota bacterium]
MTRVLGDDWLLPMLDESNRAWFAEGRVAFQACTGCGAFQHPPDAVCAGCQGTDLELREVPGEGRIESAIVVHRASHPALRSAVPYAVVLVSLDGAPGVQVVGNVVGRPPAEVAIGQRVRVHLEEVADPDGGTLRIPQWEIVAEAE